MPKCITRDEDPKCRQRGKKDCPKEDCEQLVLWEKMTRIWG